MIPSTDIISSTSTITSADAIRAAIAALPSAPAKEASRNGAGARIILRDWLVKVGLAAKVKGPKPWQGGELFEFVGLCPFSDAHTDAAWVAQMADGALAAGCRHQSCADANWKKLREKYEKTQAETFLGLTADSARAKVVDLQRNLADDPEKGAFSAAFIDASAALEHHDPAAFGRLTENLKRANKVTSISRWTKAVHDRKRQEDERIGEEKRAAKAIAGAQTKVGSGAALELADPTPADQPVDGAVLANEIAAVIRRFVVTGRHEIVAITLWLLFTYLIAVFDVAPRLAITSPAMRCGKTTLLTVIGKLAARVLSCANITAAAVYRTVEKVSPTLLLDEADTQLKRGKNDDGRAAELIGILNSGHTRATAFVIRLVAAGDDFEPRKFSTFTPIVTALIGGLPPTLADRSIPIRLERKLTTEKTEGIRALNRKANAAAFAAIQARIARWTQDARAAIAVADPVVPASLDDRAADNWATLLAIADALGGEWPDRAREAATALSKADEEEGAIGIALLRDVRSLFGAAGVDRLSSADIVEALGEMEQRPWSEYGRSRKPITAPQLARLLRPFGIAPDSIKVGKDSTVKGYLQVWFADAFARYLPSSSNSDRNPGTEPLSVRETALSSAGTEGSGPGSQNDQKPNAQKGSSAVSFQKAQIGGNSEKETGSAGDDVPFGTEPPEATTEADAAYGKARADDDEETF